MSKNGGTTAKRIRYGVVGGMLGAVVLFGGTAAAGDYPPRDTTVTTVATGGASGFSASDPASPSELAATGSSTDATLKLAGGAVVAGAGLLVAVRLRRRPAAAT